MSAHDTRFHRQLADLLKKHSGQQLMANRHWRVEMALKPVLRRHSIPDMAMLSTLLAADSEPVLVRECVEAMINNETCFYRDQANFALLTGPVLDSLREKRKATRRLRIWSAACSTGQEPYSLAMFFADNPEKWAGWSIQIFATDVSMTALTQARKGRYSQFEIQRGLPVMLMLKYFEQDGTDWQLKDPIRKAVSFASHNLLDSPRSLGIFDLILCRNMLMYLCDENRRQVLENLANAQTPDGILMLGAAETVIGQTDRFVASREFRGFYERSGQQKPLSR
jgi:chemotaxis protein methyltransferase CheR